MSDALDPLDPTQAWRLPGRLAAASERLAELRALAADVEAAVPALLPPGAPEWRSLAADRYRERLAGLAAAVHGAAGCLRRTTMLAARDVDVLADALAAARLAEERRAEARAAEARAASAGGRP